MGYKCLNSIKDANGNTVNLFTINDFSIIPNAMVTTPTHMHHIKLTPFTMTKPTYLNNGGSYYMEVNSGTNDTKYFIQSEDMELVVGKYIDGYGTTMRGYGFNYNSNEWFYIMGYANIGNIIYDIGFCIVVDEDNQRAYLLEVTYTLNHGPDGYEVWISGGKKDGHDIIWEAIYGQIITHHWQSVPSISGKNGILQSLVQIKEEAINDGEPVSEATVLSFDSLGNINIPSVIDEQMPVDPSDVTSVTATYLIPALENGTYEGIKLLVKKGSIPTSEEDADKVVNLDEPTSILRIDSKSVGNLDEDSHYYFVVKLVDEVGTEATSDPKDIWTSHSEGWTFDYTGEIQTFVAPKTGIYQLETWGAQGGDATDGTNSARGGYGAYAYGEVLLQQGDTLYINVGGQNGYGGGGINE